MNTVSERIAEREREVQMLKQEIFENAYGKDRAKELMKRNVPAEVGRMSLVVHGSDAHYIWNESKRLGLSHDAFIHKMIMTYKGINSPKHEGS